MLAWDCTVWGGDGDDGGGDGMRATSLANTDPMVTFSFIRLPERIVRSV
jgi:hypothetical protein